MIFRRKDRTDEPATPELHSTPAVLDVYVSSHPSAQNVIDIFEGQWSSAMPRSSGLKSVPGPASLFDDARVRWLDEVLGPLRGSRVLELGPLEGGHTYMFHELGAREVTAVEANTLAYLRCLCIKEIFELHRARFLLGDFLSYLRDDPGPFDIVVASGVLYHMREPVELLDLASRVSDRLMIWTHYFDEDTLRANERLAHKFGEVSTHAYGGAKYDAVEQSYLEALEWNGFCGGSEPTSTWLTRDSLLAAVENVGFTTIEVGFEDFDHPNGPAIAICARRDRAASGVDERERGAGSSDAGERRCDGSRPR